MELSSEDNLKLNVLLANADAVRINESTLCVHGLSGTNEAKIQLNPTCKADRYIKLVREALSTLVLGSPKGYPVYLRRWTRMGEMQTKRLEPLLKLGEEEALIAVARAPALTDELARRIWWALPEPNVARYMLEHPAVAGGSMGPVLAAFLVEFLPFEEQSQAVIQTVKLILQPGLVDEEQRRQIWLRGTRKNHFYVGFLHATPDDLLETVSPHPDLDAVREQITHIANNPVAQQLLKLLDAPGQQFLSVCAKVLNKPTDQDVVVSLFEAVWNYLAPARPDEKHFDDMDQLIEHTENLIARDPAVHATVAALQREHRDRSRVSALLQLAYTNEPLVRPVFARTDAVGSVMRKRIEHLTTPLLKAIETLRA